MTDPKRGDLRWLLYSFIFSALVALIELLGLEFGIAAILTFLIYDFVREYEAKS